MRFDLFVPLENHADYPHGSHYGSPGIVFIKVRDGVDAKALEDKLQPWAQALHADKIANWQDSGRLQKDAGSYQWRLLPLREVYLSPHVWSPILRDTDPSFPYVLLGVGILVFLVANVNFMTLSVSRSTSRAMEVGVRKVMGARRSDLVRQFLARVSLSAVPPSSLPWRLSTSVCRHSAPCSGAVCMARRGWRFWCRRRC